jgi:hypothetical protein
MTKVYRVKLFIHEPQLNRPDEWVIESRDIELVSKAAIGTWFFHSKQAAVQAFIAQQTRALQLATKLIRDANDALAWAQDWTVYR